MKKCTTCDIVYERGKFCTTCGESLIDIETVPILIQESKDVIKNEVNIESPLNGLHEAELVDDQEIFPKTKPIIEKKEKNIKKIILRSILAFVAFVFIGCIGYIGVIGLNSHASSRTETLTELNASQELSYQVISQLNQLESIITIDEKVINYYLNKYILQEIDVDFPMQMTVKSLEFNAKESNLYMNMSGGIVNPTFVIHIKFDENTNLILPVIESINFGKMHVGIIENVITKRLENSRLFDEGIAIPVIYDIKMIETEKKGITATVKISEDVLNSLLLAIQSGVNSELYSLVYQYEDSEAFDKTLMDLEHVFTENSLSTNIQFLKAIILDENQLAEVLSLVNEDYFKQIMTIIDQLRGTSDESYLANITKLRNQKLDVVNGLYESVVKQEQLEDLKRYSQYIIESVYTYCINYSRSNYLTEWNGLPFLLNTQQFLTYNMIAESIESTIDVSLPEDISYQLFRDNQVTYLYMDSKLGKYLYSEYGEFEEVESLEAVRSRMHFVERTLVQPIALERGSNERTLIADAVRVFTKNEKSIFIRHLKSDGKWAFIISSPGEDSQKIDQYVLKNEAGNWSVVQAFSSYEYVNNHEALLRLASEGFNRLTLPKAEVADFEIDYYTRTDIEELEQHLINIGKLNSGNVLLYFSRIDDLVVITFENGQKFIYVFDADSRNSYTSLYEVIGDQTYADYMWLLDVYDVRPEFLFIQR